MPLHPGTLRYLSAEHGIVGDLHAVSLVGIDKTIDWYCEPRFDSSCVFGALLDADHEACVPQPPSVRNQVLCIGHGQRVLVRAGLSLTPEGVRHAQAPQRVALPAQAERLSLGHPLTYCVVMLLLVSLPRGGGPFSVDDPGPGSAMATRQSGA